MRWRIERAIEPGSSAPGSLRAIVAGERDPVLLAQWHNPACKPAAHRIAKALTGTCRDKKLFILQQALAVSDDATAKIRACDASIERQCAAMKPRVESDNSPPTGPRSSQGQHPKISRGPTGERICCGSLAWSWWR